MEIINVDLSNISKENICCALSEKKGEKTSSLKKAWLSDRFKDGLVFKKFNISGKAFIEYIPAENAWIPLEANGYMYIDCFWVSGKFKGQGLGTKLLEECIKDAKSKNKKGLIALSSSKKKPFLSDPDFLKHRGFTVCDVASPYYELLYLPFEKNNSKPKFKDCCKKGEINDKNIVVYFTNQCPFTEKYCNTFEAIAKENNVSMKLIKITSKEEAQNAPTAFTTYSLFKNGKLYNNEIATESKFLQIISTK